MDLTVLVDDNSLDSNLLHEHGLCFYIEEDGKKILFDTGHTDIFLKNAVKLGINLLQLDYIVLSHGHYDHTGGLEHFLKFYTEARKSGTAVKKTTIVAHPHTFFDKIEMGVGNIGSLLTTESLREFFELMLTDKPINLTSNLIFLGEILRKNDFEAKEPMDKVFRDGCYQDDYLIDDSALVYNSEKGLSIITGCSHSGICNIIDYASEVCVQPKIKSIIGGFHLIDSKREVLEKTVSYLSSLDIPELYPCHCIDDDAKSELSKRVEISEIGAGFIVSTN